MIDLTPYIEQVGLVPDDTVCTIDIAILREFVERIAKAEEKLTRVRSTLDRFDGIEDYWMECVKEDMRD